ncbi:ABC transporter ATP-binding protein [Pseudoalteromonas phenolica]|uniref:ABC transporter ATP-binding protein n=1 Tax=Pseudoalteromonas phenolica TaxID=161398 RepID=UPI00110BFE68|nr:ATP-binding cassette domain-containing protein [Pseudoalteromonas phenolica]TMN88076.1 ABC transporter ATP-binding protein [Pseudoalteromonas phenolica]
MHIKVDNISKHYKEVTAVNRLSFEVQQGEVFALLGPNGAGKSSLVRMIVGFTQADEGQIIINVDGQTHSSIPASELGYLPEDRGLYLEKSLLQNLMYFATLRGVNKKTAKERIDYWLERFDLLERKNDQLKSLSKGNQQKVQLISAVLHKPQLVLLDEPFSGLDPVNQEKVVSFLKELKAQNMTVILSAHQMSMVEKLADRMLLMNHGQSVLYGTLADIQSQVGVGSALKVTFTHTVNLIEANAKLVHFDVEQLNDTTLAIRAERADQLNQLLTHLPELGDIAFIDSQRMDLHQLYLHAIESDQAAKKGEAA